MPDFRVDFKVKGDLVLEEESPQMSYTAGQHTYVFANGEERIDGHTSRLLVSVIGPHADLPGSIEVFRGLLADQLNLLTFVTQHRFEIEGPTIAVEWTPGPGERAFHAFTSQDARWPPAPSLSDTIFESVKRMADSNLPRHILSAARWFRAGSLHVSPESQVMQYWIAFETVIDGGKTRDQTSVMCAFCNAGLACAACKKQLMRTPMAKPLMRDFLRSGLGEESGTRMFKAFDFARNRLIHGAAVADTERRLQSEYGMSMAECAEHIGRAAYWAIYGAAAPLLGTDDQIQLYVADSLVNMNMQFAVAGIVPHAGPEEHPPLPKMQLTIQTGFDASAPPPT